MSGRTRMRRRHNSLLLKLELQVVSSEPLLRGLSFRTALAVRNLLFAVKQQVPRRFAPRNDIFKRTQEEPCPRNLLLKTHTSL